MNVAKKKAQAPKAKVKQWNLIKTDFRKNKWIYLMFLPVLVWYLLFCYASMYGAIIAFKDYVPSQGILGSQWVGLKWIKEFVTD